MAIERVRARKKSTMSYGNTICGTANAPDTAAVLTKLQSCSVLKEAATSGTAIRRFSTWSNQMTGDTAGASTSPAWRRGKLRLHEPPRPEHGSAGPSGDSTVDCLAVIRHVGSRHVR